MKRAELRQLLAEVLDARDADRDVRDRLRATVFDRLDHPAPIVVRASIDILGHWSEFFQDEVPAPIASKISDLTRARDAAVRAEALASLALLRCPEGSLDRTALLAHGLEDADAGCRQEAAAALGDLEDTGACPLLRPCLQDEDAGTRFEVAFALASLRDPAALEPLVTWLADRRRRTDAIEGLHRLGDARAIEPLRAVTSRWRTPWIERYAAFAAMVAMGDPDGRAELIEACARGRLERRAYAMHLAGRVGIWEAAAVMLDALDSGESGLYGPAGSALLALGRADELRSRRTRGPEALTEVLSELLREP